MISPFRTGPVWLGVFLLLMSFGSANAQKFIGVETRYIDSFREWNLITEDQDQPGQLWMRWPFQNDWTMWDLQVGDIHATIQQERPDDPNFWVVRCQGDVVNAKTAWTGEFYRWKLNDGANQINWEAKYSNQRDAWATDRLKDFNFQMRTDWKGDPRQWTIEDQLPEDISMAMKIAMIFLTLHFSAPHR